MDLNFNSTSFGLTKRGDEKFCDGSDPGIYCKYVSNRVVNFVNISWTIR